MSGHSVALTWTSPVGQQVRRYDVWRAVGSFLTRADAVKNHALFTDITPKGITGAPPTVPTPTAPFLDSNVKNNVTYTYFVTRTNKQGVQSDLSDPPATIAVKF
jgi:hypothetical protein